MISGGLPSAVPVPAFSRDFAPERVKLSAEIVFNIFQLRQTASWDHKLSIKGIVELVKDGMQKRSHPVTGHVIRLVPAMHAFPLWRVAERHPELDPCGLAGELIVDTAKARRLTRFRCEGRRHSPHLPMNLIAVKEEMEIFSYVATMLGIFLAVLGYRSARRDQKEATASEHYQGYLSLAVEYPNLAKGGVGAKDPEFERYQWFVSVMLHASEEILLVTENDPEWRGAIGLQLAYHKAYLAGPEFGKERAVYDKHLIALIDKVVGRDKRG